MQSQEYWNQIGSKKDFQDPFYIDRFSSHITTNSKILEYGCGYGRLMQILNSHGYNDLIGFDFAPNMIERGKKAFPHLNIQTIVKSGIIPVPDASMDAVVMSTVLCCILDDKAQKDLILELTRVLKEKGVLYISDFLVTDHPLYIEKYFRGLKEFGIQGIYTTDENLTVRHLTTPHVMKLLDLFDIQWFEQFDFKTMNGNPARTFHCIARK